MLGEIPGQSGTYLLVFHADKSNTVAVGRLGQLDIVPGYYFYIGSAFGPGGLRARIRHHHAISTRPHWHLDYIRPSLDLLAIWYSPDELRYEHAWADSLYYTMQMRVPLSGLGSSDCRCESHFYFSTNKPDPNALQRALRNDNDNMILEMISTT